MIIIRWKNVRGKLHLLAAALFIFSSVFPVLPVKADSIFEDHLLSPIKQEEDDLTTIRINLEELTEKFIELPESQLTRMEAMMGGLLTGLEKAALINLTGYTTADAADPQFLISGVITPLTAQEIILIDQQISNPQSIEELMKNMGGSELLELDFRDYSDLGNTRFGFSTDVSFFRLDYVVARRSFLLIEVAYLYREDSEPLRDAVKEAQRLDEKAIAVVGLGEQAGFRPADLLVPELTTHVPTPLDISTEPGVVGTNLFFAALIVIGFSIGVELMTRSLSEHEGDWWQKIKPISLIQKFETKLAGHLSRGAGAARILDVIIFLVVILFYGLVFSLLDRSWKPLSLTGLVLFVNMTVAYGIIGLFDDIMQWVRLRKWQVSADFSVRPSSIFLSLLSTITSRLFQLVPGLMFGTPKALKVNEELLNDDQQLTLHRISTKSMLGIGCGLWLITTLTTLLQRLPVPSMMRSLIGGVEGFFLIIFAVALENTFIQMLGFSGSVGEAFKRKNKWTWLLGLAAVTFLFYHALINPRGELAEAFQTGKVQFSLVGMVIFIIFALSVRAHGKRVARQGSTPPVPISQPVYSDALPQATADVPIQESPPGFLQGKRRSEDLSQQSTTYVGGGELKPCPVCGHSIKAEARICRYCRVLFEVKHRGYCIHDHAVVEADQYGICKRCHSSVDDLHVESALMFDSEGFPSQAPSNQINHNPNQIGIKNCPNCGKPIRANAIYCHNCQQKLNHSGI